jgi:hypothetical protein
MAIKQRDVLVDLLVQFQLAHQFVQGTDSAETDGSNSFGDLVVNVGVLEHGIGLILVLLSYQPGLHILLVTDMDFVVSFINLKCAPFGYISYMIFPIILISDAHFRAIFMLSR